MLRRKVRHLTGKLCSAFSEVPHLRKYVVLESLYMISRYTAGGNADVGDVSCVARPPGDTLELVLQGSHADGSQAFAPDFAPDFLLRIWRKAWHSDSGWESSIAQWLLPDLPLRTQRVPKGCCRFIARIRDAELKTVEETRLVFPVQSEFDVGIYRGAGPSWLPRFAFFSWPNASRRS